MGSKLSKSGRLSNQQIQQFSQLTQLQPYFIQQLHEAFLDRAKNGRMNVGQFKLAYGQINPNANIYALEADAERVFMMFDNDRNGVLTFDEFMQAYIQMQRGLVS